jgi:indole-3-glycerol phosphate synthase
VSGDFLAQMAAGSHARLQSARQMLSEAALAERARHSAPPPRFELGTGGFDLIAELKLRSPSAGRLGAEADGVARRAAAYARAGAAAVSVLTEPRRFDGSLAHLTEAARALAPFAVPAMRKDFLVDPYQLLEARVAGAGGALLIVRMLSEAQLDALLDCARAQGLFVLLEAFDTQDLERLQLSVAKHAAGMQLLAGVNCRDLVTLEVVPQRLLELAPLLPRAVPWVAESGVTDAADAHRLASAGYSLALVGSALMQDSDPTARLRSLLDAGRAVRGAA